MKKCSACKTVKPLTSFYKKASNKDGHGYECKECVFIYQHSPGGRAVATRARRKYHVSEKGRAASHAIERTPKRRAWKQADKPKHRMVVRNYDATPRAHEKH